MDLGQSAHLALLRSQVDRAGRAVLSEAPGTDAYGRFAGRAHQVVIPLATHSTKPRPVPVMPVAPTVLSRDHGHLPGWSTWVFVKLYGHPDRHNDVLTHIPDLLARWNTPQQWWFARYRDPDPHLRIRLRVADADAYGQAAARIGAWATELRRAGLVRHVVFDTYYPETGRYGAGTIMAAAETVFAADSSAVLVQLAVTADTTVNVQAVTAASMADLVIGFAGSTRDGMGWLVDHVVPGPGPAPARDVHREAVRLADPDGDWAGLSRFPGGEDLLASWATRRAALAAYRAALATDDARAPHSELAALLHMHHIRMIGPDRESEQACHRLARSAALGWTTRDAGKHR